MKVTIHSDKKIDNNLYDVLETIGNSKDASAILKFKNNNVQLNVKVKTYYKSKLEIKDPTTEKILIAVKDIVNQLHHQSNFPDRLYNHESGKNILINNQIFNKDLTFNSIDDIKIGNNEVNSNDAGDEWFVEDCRNAKSNFCFIQDVMINDVKHMIFYNIKVVRDHYEDFVTKINIEKVEKIN